MTPPKREYNLVGKTYGRLTVVEESPKINGRSAFKCLCECGTIRVVLAQSLRVGATKSCGCWHAEISGKDLTGQTFGLWQVLQVVPVRRSKKGYRFWLCRCICGTEKEVVGETLLCGRSKCCGSRKHPRIYKERLRADYSDGGRYCSRAHDTTLWGRSKDGACRACVRVSHLKRKYGITEEEFNALYEAQGGKCAICSRELPRYSPQAPGYGKGHIIEIDHDHKVQVTRRSVRGLLCGGKWNGCNRRIGQVDDLEWLKKLVAYLENPPGRQVLA